MTVHFPVDPGSPDLLRDVRLHAARANVAIHFFDPRGLTTGPDFLSAAGATGLIPGPDIGPTMALWRMEDGGAKALAEETGGLVLQTNDFVAGLAQVADESRVIYLLGYEPVNVKRDGRYRRLSVDVRRPGLRVRTRAGYFAPKGEAVPQRRSRPSTARWAALFDTDAIPLRLAAYLMGPADLRSPFSATGTEVLFAGEVRLDALQTCVKDGRLVAEPRLKLLTGSREREMHESEWTLEITLGAPVRQADEGATSSPAGADGPGGEAALWHPFVTRLVMGEGDHRGRLVVQSGDRIGSVTVDFVVPPATDERVSTPILSDRLVAGAAERRVMPLARRSFDATNTLHCWIELHGATVDPATGEPRATAAFVARSADGREWASGPATVMSAVDGRTTRLVSLPLSQAPPGENELVLTVHDGVSGRSFEAREPFEVTRAR